VRDQVDFTIVHIGVGTFHRTHQAYLLDHLIRVAPSDTPWTLVGIGLLESDRLLAEVMAAQGCVYTVVERSRTGDRADLISSITGYIHAPDHPDAAMAQLCDAATRIVSLTVTEGGYTLPSADLRHEVDHPEAPRSWPGYVVEALRRRRRIGLDPFTVQSCDNLPANGAAARDLVLELAATRDPGLAQWIATSARFPSAMVDRISPATTDEVRELAWAATGFDDRWPVQCEPYLEWRIEDDFVGGLRPPWDRLEGVSFVETVHPYEVVKLRLLNLAHQAIAYPGLLLGYRFAHEAVVDPDIRTFLDRLMDREVVPGVSPPPGVSVDQYRATVVERFANPHLGDTLERLATDSVNRLRQFAGPIVIESRVNGGETHLLALLVAMWAITVARADRPVRQLLGGPFAEDVAAVLDERPDPRALIGAGTSWCPIPGAPPQFWTDVSGWLDQLDGADATQLRRVLCCR
jgi:mannitol 2-dehydrogenase